MPDAIVAVPAVPRTLTGKKMEVPVKRLLLGRPVAEVAAPGAVADPSALEFFAGYAPVVAELSAGREPVAVTVAASAAARRSAYPDPMDTPERASASSSPSTGPGRRARAASARRRRSQLGYRFCDTGLLYRAVTWLALARNVSADGPARAARARRRGRAGARRQGRLAARPGRWRRPHRRRPQPAGRRRRLGRLGRSRSCGPRSSSVSARWRTAAGS